MVLQSRVRISSRKNTSRVETINIAGTVVTIAKETAYFGLQVEVNQVYRKQVQHDVNGVIWKEAVIVRIILAKTVND